MDPGIAGLDAFFADALVGSGELDLISMFAFHFGLLQFRQGSMNQVNCDRAFPNRRCYPFDIARAGITHCKHAGKAGLEHLWRAREWPRNGWHDSVGSVEISSMATQPCNQSVRGEAPVMINSRHTSCVEVSPEALSIQVTFFSSRTPSS